MHRNLQNLIDSTTGKSLLLVVIALMLALAFAPLPRQLAERELERRNAAEAVARDWGASQTIGGPILVLPVRYRTADALIDDELYILPDELTIEGDAAARVLKSGNFSLPVYAASLSISGTLGLATHAAAHEGAVEYLWDEAMFALPLSDTRAVRVPVRMALGDSIARFEIRGERVPGLGDQLLVPLAAFGIDCLEGREGFRIEIAFRGSGSLSFLPVGKLTRVRLDYDDSEPDFRGPYRPVELSEHDTGSTAVWRIRALGRDATRAALPAASFGVGFARPASGRPGARDG